MSYEWLQCFADLNTCDAKFLAALASRLVLTHASQFSRRVPEVLVKFPYRIFLLIKSAPNRKCCIRQGVAREILDARDKDLHAVARKLKTIYQQDLQHAKQHGTLTLWLSLALHELKRVWRAGTKESERVP